MLVPPRVLDLFAVPGGAVAVPGTGTVRAGDLALRPGRDAALVGAVSPVQARLAVRLDEAPGRGHRDLRLGLPVPARDGSWVVDGWSAARHEPGTEVCGDVAVVLGAGRLLHALLDVAVRTPPSALVEREDPRGLAEAVAFGERPLTDALVERLAKTTCVGVPAVRLAQEALAALALLSAGPDPRPQQLVHAALAGNVHLEALGAPFVTAIEPTWRPAPFAEATAVLDLVLDLGAPAPHLDELASREETRADLLRALVVRLLTGAGADDAHRTVLGLLAGRLVG
ncbi:hypothetical protein [Nocardioides bruguierae]|uniref:hypothetical protein n=1 Tax=Nocardioides bruguierae TaxID=2945102 RepID=UPI0020217026|nr:hypothetical protein [Nocardioides bruguierae]MCL8027217.1 hypothetical protein [Nocardioides bruguierae]